MHNQHTAEQRREVAGLRSKKKEAVMKNAKCTTRTRQRRAIRINDNGQDKAARMKNAEMQNQNTAAKRQRRSAARGWG